MNMIDIDWLVGLLSFATVIILTITLMDRRAWKRAHPDRTAFRIDGKPIERRTPRQRLALWLIARGSTLLHMPPPESVQVDRHVSLRRTELLEDLLCSIYLYIGWPSVTRQLTTEQRELWADLIDRERERQDESDGYLDTDMAYAPVDRWWR